ncbi:hypothetical protein ACFSC4_14520 [Deinococcus malanensis]|uniref:hypothetical protein n=1 Tax=Deinococcus malanensis TaxID=1706855 RepID=UPI003626369C
MDVVVTNTGAGESREVILTDRLADQAAAGLTYVPGSAGATSGTLEFTTDGTTWTAQETAPVRGVRVRKDSLKAAETLRLSLRMRAAEAATGRVIPNTATALTGGVEVSGTASVDVRYLPAVAIGPLGQPEAEEGSQADQQSRNFGVVGQAACFDHTAKNTGDVADLYRVEAAFPQGAAKVTLLGADGQPLAQPFALQPGQSTTVRACYEPQQASPFSALLTIRGERGTSNATTDRLQNVEAGLPELLKSYRATTVGDDGKTVDVAQGRPVRAGDTVAYILSVRNPYTRPLTAVTVSDALPPRGLCQCVGGRPEDRRAWTGNRHLGAGHPGARRDPHAIAHHARQFPRGGR